MDQENTDYLSRDELRRIVTEVVSAYVGYNSLPNSELPALIKTVHGAFESVGNGHADETKQEKQKPAVSIRKSIQNDYLVCLEDGKKLKMLKRYLRTRYDMSPEDYRRKWGLPSDYPMVAPSYSSLRSNFAKQIGLGRARTGS